MQVMASGIGDTTGISFPLIDYHVHLTDEFTIEAAVVLSQKTGVKFGIVEHPGPRYGLKNDDELSKYIETLRGYPVYVGLQPMYRDWQGLFSPELVNQLDYILMDADTVPVGEDDYLHIWRHDNYIEDVDAFMGLYMAHIEGILSQDPITIFARPTYLPVNFARHYDQVWTDARIGRMIDLAQQRNIAFEISTPMHVPEKRFILRAKAAGIQFTFGTNARNQSAGMLHYGLQMARECGLTAEDMLVL
jgi:histidinol phosphatase-like PHP family hydrolase